VGFVLIQPPRAQTLPVHAVDFVTLCIILLMLTLASRYAFGISHLFEESLRNPMAVPTFVCAGILTWLVVNRRAEYGAFSITHRRSQIGAKTTRFAAPCAILLPFVFAFASGLGCPLSSGLEHRGQCNRDVHAGGLRLLAGARPRRQDQRP
jgi:hypothetical protein